MNNYLNQPFGLPWNNSRSNARMASEVEHDIKLEDIHELLGTEQVEDERSDFDSTFDKKINVDTQVSNSELSQSQMFYDGLIENKENLCKTLGLDSEQYDSLSCVALALASQETGMGLEDGYIEENSGPKKTFRNFAIKFMAGDYKLIKWVLGDRLNGSSASSGLTQLKIDDYYNSLESQIESKGLVYKRFDDNNLDGDSITEKDAYNRYLNGLPEADRNVILQKLALDENGIVTTNSVNNNLYSEPDKAAVATIVMLKSLTDSYDSYSNIIDEKHQEIEDEFSKKGIDSNSASLKGIELISNIYNIYNQASNDDRMAIRTTFKQVFLSKDDTKAGDYVSDGDSYNEGVQLDRLTELLQGVSEDFSMPDDAVDYIKYAMTSEDTKMSMLEYLPYAWNKGTGYTGMQVDRTLAEKIGIILTNPEDYDYDQFASNVVSLAERYAKESVGDDSFIALNSSLSELE